MSSYPPPPAYQQPEGRPDQPQNGGEPPIWAPWYGIGFVDAIKRFFKKYADFSGRASRSEFWWYYLAAFIVFGILGGINLAITISAYTARIVAAENANGTLSTASNAGVSGGGVALQAVIGLISLALLVPSLAIIWRRLHDTGRPGPYYFFGLIPIVGPIMLIVFLASASKPEGQRYDVPR